MAGLRIDTEKVLELEEKKRSVETINNVAPLVAALELEYSGLLADPTLLS